MNMQLTQVAEICPNDKAQTVLSNLSKISNGLYNSALYLNCKKYDAEKKFVFYEDMCKILKENDLYSLLPAQSSQAVLQKVEGGIKSFLKLKEHGYKEAQFPHYHKKDTEWMVAFKSGVKSGEKSTEIKVKRNTMTLSMSREYRRQTGISYIHFKIPKLRYDGSIKYVEIFRIDGKWKAHLVFEVKNAKLIPTPRKDNLYIDLGVRNSATIWDGKKTMIYAGGKIRANLQYKDKEVAKIQETLSHQGLKSSRAKRELARKTRIKNIQAIHAMTTRIVHTAKLEGKGIVIGELTGIRQDMDFSKQVNQQNHQWEFREISRQLEYKSKLEGVRFRKVSEKDTSKTCALCGQKENGRIHRGLYRCKLYNVVFNADADGALNISKKYLRIPLSKGSGIGVVDALANPAVFHWNEHEWLDEAPFRRGSGVR